MQRLGNHTGKSCLYIKRLGDVDQNILEELLELLGCRTGRGAFEAAAR